MDNVAKAAAWSNVAAVAPHRRPQIEMQLKQLEAAKKQAGVEVSTRGPNVTWRISRHRHPNPRPSASAASESVVPICASVLHFILIEWKRPSARLSTHYFRCKKKDWKKKKIHEKTNN